MAFQTRDVGHGVLYGRNPRGDVIGCQTILGHCAGCGRPLVAAESKHDGPSGSGRIGKWDLVAQSERDRIERIRFELRGGFKVFEDKQPTKPMSMSRGG